MSARRRANPSARARKSHLKFHGVAPQERVALTIPPALKRLEPFVALGYAVEVSYQPERHWSKRGGRPAWRHRFAARKTMLCATADGRFLFFAPVRGRKPMRFDPARGIVG